MNENTKTYSPFAKISEVEPRYQPASDLDSFDLINVLAPVSKVETFKAYPNQELHNFYIQNENIRFAIHPEIWTSSNESIDHLSELRSFIRLDSIRVAPTASTRTVLTMDVTELYPTHFIKLHYPRRISRFNRRLRRKNIRNSVGVSKDLEQINFEKFAYLPDCLGFTFSDAGNPWGFLVRELRPRPFREDRFLIPFFSLYGGDKKHPGDSPLLIQMIEHLKIDPKQFVVHEIMIPVVECWCKAARERGLIFESHAQNILLEVDRNFRPQRIVHRDFDIWIDGNVRKSAKLNLSDFESFIEDNASFPRSAHYSLVYDHFIGREMFSYLGKVLQDFYGIETDEVHRQISESFHKNFPEARHFFPENTTYYFPDELLPGNEFTLVETKQSPEWR